MAKASAVAKLSKEDKEKCRIETPRFRVSYPHLFKPQQVKPTDKPKYSVTMLFPKDSDLSTIKRAMKRAKINAFGPNKKDWPEDLESPVTDGDNKKFTEREGYAGHYAIKASTGEDQKPTVINRKKKPITTASELYPGCYARAIVFAYVWEYMGKQGVGFILDHVQKLEDGESFGGKRPAEQAFSPLEDGDDDEDEETSGDDDEDEDEEEIDFR